MALLLLLACAHHPAAVQLDTAPPVLYSSAPSPLPAAKLVDRRGEPVAGELSWSIRDPAIARLEGDTVVPVHNGTTTLVASSGDVQGTWALTVAIPNRVEIAASSTTIPLGGTATLSAVAFADDMALPALPVRWSSSAEQLASVDSSGRVRALGMGSVELRAEAGGAVGTIQVTIDPAAQLSGIGGLIGARGTSVGSFGSQRGVGGTVVLTDLVVGPGLDQAAVEAVFKRTMNQLRYCYQRELTRDATLGGRSAFAFDVQADGTVSGATITASNVSREAVGACQVGRVSRLQFPAPTPSPVHVTFAMVHTP